MIQVYERQSNRLPGITSLYLSFNFNQSIIDTIKNNCEAYDFNKKTKEWELPVKNCSNILDLLSFLDDILINILPNKENAVNVELNMNYKTPPKEYQIDAIKFGMSHDKWLLLDGMGLGKTLSSIYIAQELKERGLVNHCLVICGVDSLRTNWKKEIEKHSYLDCRVLGEKISSKGTVSYATINDRNTELANNIQEFFIVTNVSNIRDSSFVDAFNHSKTTIDMIIVDEIHRCNNATQSQQGKNLLKLKAKYKLGLSGTLWTNDILGLFAPIKWVTDSDLTMTSYKNYFCNLLDNRPISYKNTDELHNIVSHYSLRRTKDFPEIAKQLPTKTIIDEYVDMSDEHKKLYSGVINAIKSEVDLVNINRNNLLGMVVRLRQATSCPNLLTSKSIISSKILRCKEKVEELVSQGEKVVVFTSFKEVVKLAYEQLKEFDPYVITGDTPQTKVDNDCELFQTTNDRKVLIATYQKLGTGYNLNSARYLIFIDYPWTAFEYDQASDRVHRLGSTQPVFIFNLICPNTIDEKVIKAINKKRALSNYVIDGVISNEKDEDILKELVEDLF